jgi:hypothetical protein
MSGLLGGLWAFVDRKKGRGKFLYAARLSIESGWKVAVKRGTVKPIKYYLFVSKDNVRGGDVVLFALSLGILMAVFERAPESVTGTTVRKSMSWISGKGFIDPVPGADELRSIPTAPSTAPTSTTSSVNDDVNVDSDEGSPGSSLLSMGSASGEAVEDMVSENE